MSESHTALGSSNEREPLLSRESAVIDGGNQQTASASGKSTAQSTFQRFKTASRRIYQKTRPRFETVSRRYRFIPLLGCLIIFFNESEYMVKQVALMRAIESMHCLEYYERHDPDIAALGKSIPENLCKHNSIQKQVAKTAALQLFFRMFCSMLGCIPLGYVADKKGRWIVLALHKINVVCSNGLQILVYKLYPRLPIWCLYFSGVPGLIGGNFDLGLAMLFASYTDVLVSESQRTTLFFLTTSMQYPAQAIGPLIGGYLMDLDGNGGTPEIALYVGFASGFTALLITLFLFPETIQEARKSQNEGNIETTDDEDSLDESRKGKGVRYRVARKFNSMLHSAEESFHGIGIGNMLLLSISILAAGIGIKSTDWLGLIQYPIIKLHWKYSQASVVVSIQAMITLFNYAVLLPSYTHIGTKRLHLSSAKTSLAIMLFSVVLLTSGAIVIGFSATAVIFFVGLLVYTLGGGLPVATQAYIASMIDKSKLARTLANLSIASVGGKVLASALFPKALAAGLDDGRDFMKGLPLFIAAALFVVAGLAIIVVAVTTPDKSSMESEHENMHSTED